MYIPKNMTGCAVIVLAIGFAGAVRSADIYVSPAGGGVGTPGNPTGLQNALNIAAGNGAENDIVHLQQGTYWGNFTYLPAPGNNGGLEILGGWSTDFSTRTVDPANTILDGNNTGRVLLLNVHPTEFTCETAGGIKVEGITVRKGNARIGAGIFAYTKPPGSIELNYTILEHNTAQGFGGGLGGGCTFGCANLGASSGIDIRLTNNIIRHNSAQGDAGENGEGGGCVILSSGTTWIMNNLIHNNSAGTNDIAYGLGGGIILDMYAGNGYVISNTIIENIVHARSGSTDGTGGGILVETDEDDAWAGSNVHVYNNIIYHNTCVSPIGSDDIANNIAGSGLTAGTLVLSHNDYGEYGTNMDAVVPTFMGNIHADPRFSSTGETLYYLTSRSPCVDAGDNSAPYIPPFDLAGQIRIQDGDNDGTAIVNMGCYEEVIPGGPFPWPMFLPTIMSGSPEPPTGTVFSAGQLWMDRNLGASRVAASRTDPEAYGDLYQWGRLADGHQNRTSLTTSTLSASDVPGHGNFIVTSDSPYNDWRSPQNDSLWQGVSGTNNPCPAGFRLPTRTEFEVERLSWGTNDVAGAFASPLKLVPAGFRSSWYDYGSLYNAGSIGYYWTSSVHDGGISNRLDFDSGSAFMGSDYRGQGFSVRCIKD